MSGDDIIVWHAGLAAGEQVAASGAFKLRDGVLVVAAGGPVASRINSFAGATVIREA